MSRETAITEEISYETDYCKVCGDEVAIDEVPKDVIEPQGYTVLLGEGTITRDSEGAGNWDEEIHFEFGEKKSHLPNVSAYIICENCAEAIHGIPMETTPYTGRLPTEVSVQSNTAKTEVQNWVKVLFYLLGAIFLLIILVILF
jgi:hypothetical protein